jgi:hypothetical protein
MKFSIILSLIFLLSFQNSHALPLKTRADISDTPPPRIIRTCCSFGSEVKVTGIPFLKVSDITSVDKLGPHKYLGNDEENNGIIYTKLGGFIDIGHLRDQADWTAYLFKQIDAANGEAFNIELGREGGHKNLEICADALKSDEDKILLAGSIAYNLSVWHEIATYYGASYIPMVPERYSAFSIEDAYSNLLGVKIGMEALKSNLPFEKAVTYLLAQKLQELEAVASAQETHNAMESVVDIWWTRDAKLPSKNILLKREFDIQNCLKPWLIEETSNEPKELCVTELASNGVSLNQFYELSIQLNAKFPVKRILPKEVKRVITQKDFDVLINEAIRKESVHKAKNAI